MTGRERDTGAALLRRLREARGWSWSDLARALRATARGLGISSLSQVQTASVQRGVARWESVNCAVGPGERSQLLLAHVYARTVTGELSVGGGSEFDVLLTALRHFDVAEARLRELRELVIAATEGEAGAPMIPAETAVSPVLARALRNPSRLDQTAVAELYRLVGEVDRKVGAVPFVRLRLRLEPVVDWCRRLTAMDTPAGLRNELFPAASKAFTLAGRLAFETGDDRASASLYRASANVAAALGDSWHLAAAHASHAMVTHYAVGSPSAAREIARAAVNAANRGSSITVRARALAVEAELSARSGLPHEADIALLRARKTIDRDTEGDPNGEFGDDRIDGFEGVCRLHTDRPASAAEHLERSIDGLRATRSAVQLGINTADLAIAVCRLGDPQASAELVHKSVDVAARTGGRVPRQRIRQARRELRPWRAESFVADLDDHIHDALLNR